MYNVDFGNVFFDVLLGICLFLPFPSFFSSSNFLVILHLFLLLLPWVSLSFSSSFPPSSASSLFTSPYLVLPIFFYFHFQLLFSFFTSSPSFKLVLPLYVQTHILLILQFLSLFIFNICPGPSPRETRKGRGNNTHPPWMSHAKHSPALVEWTALNMTRSYIVNLLVLTGKEREMLIKR